MSDNFDFDWNGELVIDDVNDVSKKALLENGLDLQQESAEEAPIDKGDLKGNASVDTSELQREGVIHVGYSLPYSLPQHELLDLNHPQGGKAKFLEDPFNRKSQAYIDHIANAVDGVTK